MYTTRAKTFELLQIMIQDVKKLQIRLDSMATQLEKMDDLAQKVEAPSNAQPIQPSYKTTVSRPEATKKNPDDISPTKGKKRTGQRHRRHQQRHQRVLTGFGRYPNHLTENRPFEGETTAEIVDGNFALIVKDVKLAGASEFISIRSAVRLLTCDVKIYTQESC